MAWTESGLYAATLKGLLGGTVTGSNWLATSAAKIFLTGSADTPNYLNATPTGGSGGGEDTGEVYGTGWAQYGVTVSTAAAGSTSLAPALATGASPDTADMTWSATNLSVASTTISTGAYGAKWYLTGTTPANYCIIGIWFGGNPYTTSAGTFAITWNAAGIAYIRCAT